MPESKNLSTHDSDAILCGISGIIIGHVEINWNLPVNKNTISCLILHYV